MGIGKKVVWIIFMLCVHWSASYAEFCTIEQSSMSRVINHLSFRVTNEIEGNVNLFFSPLSISLAMGMVYLGATGNTADEIRNALGYDLLGNVTNEDVHLHFHSLLTDLNDGAGDYQLLIANSIFTQVGFEVLQKYADNLGLYYHAQQDSVDFASDGIDAIHTINEWVSEKTKQKIPKLFQTPLNTLTVFALLNAVYFKGMWKYPFNPEGTHYRNFYGMNGLKEVQFMHQSKRLNYYHDPETDYDFLELPYKGNRISMVFAQSRSANDSALDLNAATFCRIRNGLRLTSIDLYIPRFKLTYEKELSDILRDFGINNAFDESTASFTGIRKERDISISLIKHKAVIDVNEQGSEAAASTGVVFEARSGFSLRTRFVLDHPFLFFILDKTSGSILFQGRLNDPPPEE